MSDRQINDGGPAFPVHRDYEEFNPGMSLRDYFAAKAMHAMYTSAFEWEPTGKPRDAESRGIIAEMALDAYGIADAMLKAREQR